MFHACTTHIETHNHFIFENVLTQDIDQLKIRIEEQGIDILTKALYKVKLK